MFELIPAIDLSDGKVVRLERGDFSKKTVYHNDAAVQAKQFIDLGVQRLHIVDLDGAKSGIVQHWEAIESAARASSVPIQVGGGIREIETAKKLLDLPNIDRVIISTAATESPEVVETFVNALGADAVLVSIDIEEGALATRGWKSKVSADPVEFGKNIFQSGVRFCVYTDIRQDGMMTGPNITSAARYSEQTGLSIILAGGISSITDIEMILAQDHPGIAGAITGRAVYEGRIDLAEAVKLCQTAMSGGQAGKGD